MTGINLLKSGFILILSIFNWIWAVFYIMALIKTEKSGISEINFSFLFNCLKNLFIISTNSVKKTLSPMYTLLTVFSEEYSRNLLPGSIISYFITIIVINFKENLNISNFFIISNILISAILATKSIDKNKKIKIKLKITDKILIFLFSFLLLITIFFPKNIFNNQQLYIISLILVFSNYLITIQTELFYNIYLKNNKYKILRKNKFKEKIVIVILFSCGILPTIISLIYLFINYLFSNFLSF